MLATRNGLEPSTSSVTGWRANRLHHRAKNEVDYIIEFGICKGVSENFFVSDKKSQTHLRLGNVGDPERTRTVDLQRDRLAC